MGSGALPLAIATKSSKQMLPDRSPDVSYENSRFSTASLAGLGDARGGKEDFKPIELLGSVS
jgi:hypothetical protein